MAKSIIDDIEEIRRRQKELFPNRPYEGGLTEKEKSRIAGDKPTFTMEYRTGGSGEFAGKRIDANGFVSDAAQPVRDPCAKRFPDNPPPAPAVTHIPAQNIQTGHVTAGASCAYCKDTGWMQSAIGLIECKHCGNPHGHPCP